MDQYEGSGPEPDKSIKQPKDDATQMRLVKDRLDAQDQLIKDLQTEIRRLKSKLDAHAVTINQIKRG